MTAIKDSRDKRKTLGKSVTKLMNADAGEDEATALEAFTEAEKKINDDNQSEERSVQERYQADA